MKASFNLVDEPWIPCVNQRSGERHELGLRELLAQAPELRDIDDPSPLVAITIYRLLLAVLHRVFGPESIEDWQALWQRGGWDTAVLDGYFDAQRNRFDLFDAEYPFYQYQAAGLDVTVSQPVALLAHELASGNNATLFDHTYEAAPTAVSPAQAARYLLAFHGFAFGGRITGESESGKAGPLTKGALVVVRGDNLFETLMLNLHQYSHEEEQPFPIEGDDCPAWERNEEPRPIARRPSGYLDLLTWQSRRIRLLPEAGGAGKTVVRFAVVRKGYWFPDDFYRRDAETMVAFGWQEKPGPNSGPYPPVALQEDRAVWRDSHALYHGEGADARRPRTLDWLHEVGRFAKRDAFPLDVYGLCSDQAKALLWRHERLALPLAYLGERELSDALHCGLRLAEAVGVDLRAGIKVFAKDLRSPTLADSLEPTRRFWAKLEIPFTEFLQGLPADRMLREDGSPFYGKEWLPRWTQRLREIATAAFDESVRDLDTSARLLKAAVAAERVFYSRLHKTLAPYQNLAQGSVA